HEVGPGDLAAVLLFDGPQQAARPVEEDVVGPTVQRCEALLAAPGAAAAVADAVGAGAVPRHADEQWAVVAEVRRPPLLRVGHQRRQIRFHRRQVEALELPGVIKVPVHGVGLRGVLVQQFEPQLIRPPVLVAGTAGGVREGAVGWGRHKFSRNLLYEKWRAPQRRCTGVCMWYSWGGVAPMR